jgi:hypothetical protein
MSQKYFLAVLISLYGQLIMVNVDSHANITTDENRHNLLKIAQLRFMMMVVGEWTIISIVLLFMLQLFLISCTVHCVDAVAVQDVGQVPQTWIGKKEQAHQI